jgi:hypothetical protein
MRPLSSDRKSSLLFAKLVMTPWAVQKFLITHLREKLIKFTPASELLVLSFLLLLLFGT